MQVLCWDSPADVQCSDWEAVQAASGRQGVPGNHLYAVQIKHCPRICTLAMLKAPCCRRAGALLAPMCTPFKAGVGRSLLAILPTTVLSAGSCCTVLSCAQAIGCLRV